MFSWQTVGRAVRLAAETHWKSGRFRNKKSVVRRPSFLIINCWLPRYYKSSVTIWLDHFSKFGHLQQWKLAQWCHKFAKVGSALCQIRDKPSKICQRLVNFCQSVKNLPNLVTLMPSHLDLRLFRTDWYYR